MIRIGTSGWIYKHWRGIFYPSDVSRRELEFYAQHFSTVEINYSFYRLPGRHVFEDWAARPPEGMALQARVLAVSPTRRLLGGSSVPPEIRLY